MDSVPAVEAERLVTEARRLVPLLRARAEEAASSGRLAVDSEVALRDAGLFTLQAPRSRGGCEAGLRTAIEVYRELAHGCSSSAWNAMILSGGAYVASLLGERARDDIWRADPRAAVSISLAPSGASRRVEGGVVASARCQPLSGVDQSQWVMVHVPETDEHGTVTRPVLVLVPISEVSVERTWNVAGMQATGSNTVVLKDVFVPEHRIVSFAKILSGGYAADHSE